MTNFIPIFPLEIVVYPGEDVNLHIFEPRYKQLIADCNTHNKPFGIPSVIEGKLAEMGTMVELVEITKRYEDGKMDIKIRGVKVFRLLEVVKEIPDKLYSGAIVNYPDNSQSGSREMMQRLISDMKKLHQLLKIKKDFKKPDDQLQSYDLAHHLGLSLTEEYELLELMLELHRQEYLKRHIKKVMAVMGEVENLKKKVRLNGHFKNLKGFDI